MPGLFVISLDFELHWGVRDHSTVEDYKANLLGVRQAIPAMLDLFRAKDIAATWATVGFLFAETKKELEGHFPALLPTYDNRKMSPYEAMGDVGLDEASDPFHFAPSLLRMIQKTPRQEIATHTFSHFYCLEPGQTPEQFDADLAAAASISRDYGDVSKSIVFPRNQLDTAYVDVLRRRGVRAYRSNGRHWAYRAASRETPQRRIFRLADAYLPLSKPRAEMKAGGADNGPLDVPASAFLRPWSPRLRTLEPVRLARLTRAMTHAAKHGKLFHLWWHPHNFGTSTGENIAFLSRLLDTFGDLRRRYGMESVSMAGAAGVA